jgi:hypothetical protein
MIERDSHQSQGLRGITFLPALLVAVFVTAVLASCFHGPVVVGYRSLTIEPGTLRTEWSDPIFAQVDENGRVLPVVGDYFFPSAMSGGGFFVNHLSRRDAQSPLIRYMYLEVSADHVLNGRSVKTRELMNGAFGEVFATKTCFYSLPPERWTNHFDVQSYSKQEGFEPPTVQQEKPTGTMDVLHYLSVIRVFRAAPEYLVITAVYSSDNRLRSVYINGSKGGDWVHTNYLTGFEKEAVSSGKARAPDTLRRYGLPEQIDIERYQRKFDSPLSKPALKSVTDAVNLHFNFGEWTRQDEFVPDGSHQTWYLTYTQTAEDRILDPLCNQRFADQLKRGIDPPY